MRSTVFYLASIVLAISSGCSGARPTGPGPNTAAADDAGGGPASAGTGGSGAGAAKGPGGKGGAGKGGAGSAAADGGGLGSAGSGSIGSTQCSDGVDNDGDGLIDGFDPECTGPRDNDEGSFATGIPGDNVDPKWQDCFFDGNSGGGDDGCRYSTKCLTGELPQTDKDCKLAQHCIDFCQPLAPNGCDCFGCCEVHQASGAVVHIVVKSGCDLAHLGTCTTCMPSTQCQNQCGECELCAGKTSADLPASCGTTTGGGGTGGAAGTGAGGAGGTGGAAGTGGSKPPAYTCDTGETVCASNADCDAGHYCAYGCCIVIPPQ